MSVELRSRSAEVRVDRRVEFRGRSLPSRFWCRTVSYEVADDYGTIWNRGVFDESARMPVMMYGHAGWQDLGQVLGRGVDYRDTPTGAEHLLEFSDFEVVPLAAQAAHHLDTGTLQDVSAGFTRRRWEGGPSGPGQVAPLRDADRARGGVERMLAADADEVSIVVVGAVPGAKVLAMRSRLSPAVLASPTVRAAAAQLAAVRTSPRAVAPMSSVPLADPARMTTRQLEALADELLGGR